MIDYSKVINKTTTEMKPSGIRKFFDLAATKKGTISLGVGEPDFQTPWPIRQAAITALERGKTFYTANAGLAELRGEISKYVNDRVHTHYDPDSEIIVTVGGSEAIDLSIRAVVEQGDEVLVVEPCFVCYRPIVDLCGGKVVTIETKAEDNFKLTKQELKDKITEKTKVLILPFPNNPTGAIMTKEDLEEIAEVLRETNIIVLSDEIYSELTYGRDHFSIVEIEGMKERTILINGFSKAFAMTGWRLGYLCGPKEMVCEILKIHQYAIMSSPTVSQYAAIKALNSCRSDVKEMCAEYDMRRLDCFTPEGAFYVFPCIKSTGLSSEDFCERLLFSKNVAVVPGNAFGECGEGFIRVSYAYSLKHLKTALKYIGEFLNELKSGEL